MTVIVPARNEAQVLPSTLPALLRQDYPGCLRIVVVDDSSTDGTADVARGLGAPPLRRRRRRLERPNLRPLAGMHSPYPAEAACQG